MPSRVKLGLVAGALVWGSHGLRAEHVTTIDPRLSALCENIFRRIRDSYHFNELKFSALSATKIRSIGPRLWTIENPTPNEPHELRGAQRYLKFLHQHKSAKIDLLIASYMNGRSVPAVDGVVFGQDGKATVNVTFKAIFGVRERSEDLLKYMARVGRDAHASLRKMNSDEMLMVTADIANFNRDRTAQTTEYLLRDDWEFGNLKKRVRLHVFQRLFGMPFARSHRKTALVIDLSAGPLTTGERMDKFVLIESAEGDMLSFEFDQAYRTNVTLLQANLRSENTLIDSYVYLRGQQVVEITQAGTQLYEFDEVNDG